MMDRARQIHHPKRASPLPPASAPSKASGPVRAQHHSCDAVRRQKINHPSLQFIAIPYEIPLTGTRRRDRLVMITLPVVGRHKLGSSILLLERS